ncbi:hypothetical protein LguiB_003934 [Lonicera macranthoides]
MVETLHLSSTSNPFPKPNFQSKHSSIIPPLSRPRNLNFPPTTTTKTSIISPLPIPPRTSTQPHQPLPQNPNSSEFQEKLLFLDSLGLDFFSLVTTHPPIVSASISSIKSTISFLYTVGLTPQDLRRALSMCPDIITSPDVVGVLTFLLRDVGVEGRQLRQVVRRRPRLLACSVEQRLRPTLYFLQGTIGIPDLRGHTQLLSCSVESKFVPRIEYIQKLGFSYNDTISMFRRFPSLFCYGIEENLEPKFNYFMVEMGRDLKELKEFPQYFSFSLENRIKPRHRHCVEMGVCLSLPVMLRLNNERFRERLEVCCSSTMPVRTSPLWCINYDDHVL